MTRFIKASPLSAKERKRWRVSLSLGSIGLDSRVKRAMNVSVDSALNRRWVRAEGNTEVDDVSGTHVVGETCREELKRESQKV